MILEKYDVGKIAVISGLACKSDLLLDVSVTGNLKDLKLEVRVLLLISSLCSLKCRDIEVSIPCLNCKSVLIL